jgi:hypothetical protein
VGAVSGLLGGSRRTKGSIGTYLVLLQKRILIDNSATFAYYHCNELNNLMFSSYQERWRDWPFEASAAGS